MKLPLDKCARWCYNVKYKGNDGKSTLIRWYREQAVGASLSEGKWKTTPEPWGGNALPTSRVKR